MQAVLHLGGQASFIPGGVGVEDGGYAAFMSPFMGAEAMAFTLLVWRFFIFYWYLILGGPIFCTKSAKPPGTCWAKRCRGDSEPQDQLTPLDFSSRNCQMIKGSSQQR